MQRNIVSPTKGNVVYYKPDGTGRDTYIENQNGGFLGKDLIHQKRNKSITDRQKMKFGKPSRSKHQYVAQNKFTHYISDGSGRDFYITSNDGGNVRVPRWRDQVGHKFRATLRDYTKLPPTNPQKLDMFTITQSQMTKSQSWRTQGLSQSQFHQTMRLSQPKMCRDPPPISSYFPNSNYNRARSMRICEHSSSHFRN